MSRSRYFDELPPAKRTRNQLAKQASADLKAGIASIAMLSDESLDIIFSYFSPIECVNSSMVCKLWYDLCCARISLITTLDCRNLSKQFKTFVRSNRIVHNRRFGKNAIVSIISQNCGVLTMLHLGKINIDDSLIKLISENCPNLLGLHMHALEMRLHTSKVLGEFLPKKLKYLAINNVDKEEYLSNILENAENLEMLNVQWSSFNSQCITKKLSTNKFTSFNFVGCYHLEPATVEFILKTYSDTLEHLNISLILDQDLCYRHIDIDSKKMEKMMYLYAAGSRSYDCQQTINTDIFKIMPNLKVLDLTNNCKLSTSPDFISVLANLCPHIEELNLSGCLLYAHLLKPLKCFKSLKKLYLEDITVKSKFFGSDFDYNRFTCEVLIHLNKLQYLSFVRTDIGDRAVLNILVNPIINIVQLDLRSCRKLVYRDMHLESFLVKSLNYTITNFVEVLVDPKLTQHWKLEDGSSRSFRTAEENRIYKKLFLDSSTLKINDGSCGMKQPCAYERCNTDPCEWV